MGTAYEILAIQRHCTHENFMYHRIICQCHEITARFLLFLGISLHGNYHENLVSMNCTFHFTFYG